jgi:drug/metabolite transporter (DMT)-like permease
VLSGVVAIVLYGIALTKFGATAGSAFVALVPGLAALIAVPALAKLPSRATVVAIILSAAGVALLTGVASIESFRKHGAPGTIGCH